MAIDERGAHILSQWGRNANTNIPMPPVPNQPYRKELDADIIAQGQGYSTIADVSVWNEVLYQSTGVLDQLEKWGVLPWSSKTSYPAQALTLGTNGIIYRALVDNINVAPPNSAYWAVSVPLDWNDGTIPLAPMAGAANPIADGTAGRIILASDDEPETTRNKAATPAYAWSKIVGSMENPDDGAHVGTSEWGCLFVSAPQAPTDGLISVNHNQIINDASSALGDVQVVCLSPFDAWQAGEYISYFVVYSGIKCTLKVEVDSETISAPVFGLNIVSKLGDAVIVPPDGSIGIVFRLFADWRKQENFGNGG